jgi:hypothetical protein
VRVVTISLHITTRAAHRQHAVLLAALALITTSTLLFISLASALVVGSFAAALVFVWRA